MEVVSPPQPEPFVIGYALAQKKIKSFMQDSLRIESHKKGVKLVPIDMERPLSEQGPFDAILHKITNNKWYSELRSFSRLNPDVIILDPPDAIEKVHNRASMLEAMAQDRAFESGYSVGIPKQCVIEDERVLLEAFNSSGLKFPVIAKPLVADGTAGSHLMWLVFSENGLKQLAPPCVLQEFINHGAVIFKVYVVGDYVKCVRRKSLPDTNESDLDHPTGLKSFSHISNLTGPGSRNGALIDRSLASTELPPTELVTSISSRLRRKLGLELFNFDLIKDQSAEGHYCIVDINYFPGYAKMPDYESVMSDFFSRLPRRKKLQCGLHHSNTNGLT